MVQGGHRHRPLRESDDETGRSAVIGRMRVGMESASCWVWLTIMMYYYDILVLLAWMSSITTHAYGSASSHVWRYLRAFSLDPLVTLDIFVHFWAFLCHSQLYCISFALFGASHSSFRPDSMKLWLQKSCQPFLWWISNETNFACYLLFSDKLLPIK